MVRSLATPEPFNLGRQRRVLRGGLDLREGGRGGRRAAEGR